MWKVLAVALCVAGVSAITTDKFFEADPQPIYPAVFYSTFNESTKVIEGHTTTGAIWYDSANKRERIDRASGLGDRYCGSVKHKDTPCTHLVLDEVRYLVFPKEEYCCACCTAEKGCGIVEPNWLQGAEFNGTEVVEGKLCNRFMKKGLQPNFYSNTADGRPCNLDQMPNDLQQFQIGSFKPGPFDDSVFQLPSYCAGKKCPLVSICTIA